MKLSAVILALLSVGHTSFQERDRRFSPSSAALAEARRTDIRAEADLLPPEHWAGDYYRGDGLGVNQSLSLAPDAGFVFEWHGCLGLYDRNYGALRQRDGRILLQPELENVAEGFQGTQTDFQVVRWGARVYLVASSEVQDFCDDVNAGWEPRNGLHGSTFLKIGHEKLEAPGGPLFPEGVANCVLDRPIESQVLAVLETRPRPDCCCGVCTETIATIDGGRMNGLRMGTSLYPRGPRGEVWYESVTVIDVRETDATVRLVHWNESAVPKVGLRLSTRAVEDESREPSPK